MQGESTGLVYGGLTYQARCIADVSADPDNTSFLAGTLSLKEENEVHLIRLSPSGTELICEGLFYHPNEIWDLKSCPFDSRIFSTVFTSGETYGAAIWGIPELCGQSNAPQLEEVVSLNENTSKVKCVLWWPRGRHDKVISIDEGNIILWNIDSSSKTAKVWYFGDWAPERVTLSAWKIRLSHDTKRIQICNMFRKLSGGSWDPHSRHIVSTICDSSLQCWDLRTMKKSTSIENAHFRDMDYNPKKQHIIVTAEDQSGVHVWDLRNPNFPLAELPGHVHWTWAVRYNPEYAELILTAGTDSSVNLLALTTGSNDSPHESVVDYGVVPVDTLLHSFSDYEDSVYGLAWSFREPTIFASLSYDGRVVVEFVRPYLQKKL